MRNTKKHIWLVLGSILLLSTALQAQTYRPFRHADLQPASQDNQPAVSSYDASAQSYQSTRHIAGTSNPFEATFDANNHGANAIANPNATHNGSTLQRLTTPRDLSDANIYTETENNRTYTTGPRRVEVHGGSEPLTRDDDSPLQDGDTWVWGTEYGGDGNTYIWVDGYWTKLDENVQYGTGGTILPVGNPLVMLLFAACAALAIFFRRRVHNA